MIASPYYAFAGAFTTALTSPDGDTIRFRPDTPRHLAALRSARPVEETITVRLEAVDAPELHYAGMCQRRAAAARTRLLHRLGFRAWELAGDWVTRAVETRGVLVANQIDVYGRAIGFVYRAADLPLARDGEVDLDRPTLLASANASLLESGVAYHLAYSTLAAPLRQQLQQLALLARRARRGVWASDSTPAFPFRGLASVCERGALVFPKLFRRCVAFCQEAGGTAGDFVEWLRAHPASDDWVFVGGKRRRLSGLLSGSRDRVRVSADPMGIVFDPKG